MILGRCIKPTEEPCMLSQSGFRAIFRVEIPPISTDAAAGNALPVSDLIAVEAAFNWGQPTCKFEFIAMQKELDVLSGLPEHRNLTRVIFHCVCEPPLWMVEMLPDPASVCMGDSDTRPDAVS